MALLSDDVLAAFHADMESLYGRDITYVQGTTSTAIKARRAAPAQHTYSPDIGAVSIDSSAVEWRFVADDLGFIPARGDTITDDAGIVYRVMSGQGGAPIWRYLDSSKLGMAVLAVPRQEAS